MRGFLILSPVVHHQVHYRNPNEEKLAKELNEARETLSSLISTFIGRLFDFRTPNDVWIDASDIKQIGLISGIHGEGYRLVVKEDELQRDLHELEFAELTSVFEHLPKLRSAVIAESFDYLADMQAAISEFRDKVLGVATDDDMQGGSE